MFVGNATENFVDEVVEEVPEEVLETIEQHVEVDKMTISEKYLAKLVMDTW